jgi:phage tail sheath protein FI
MQIGCPRLYFCAQCIKTWVAIKEMISNFLNGLWKESALQGGQAADAFAVACGLGETITSDDILNGILVVTVKVAVRHPAEFEVITFSRKWQ